MRLDVLSYVVVESVWLQEDGFDLISALPYILQVTPEHGHFLLKFAATVRIIVKTVLSTKRREWNQPHLEKPDVDT